MTLSAGSVQLLSEMFGGHNVTLNTQNASTWHRITSVNREIYDNLFQTVGVDWNKWLTVAQLHSQTNVLSQDMPEHPIGVNKDLVYRAVLLLMHYMSPAKR